VTGATHLRISIPDSPQLISLIWGSNWHIFKPTEVPFESEEYPLQVLIKQVSIFGPVPMSYGEIADDDRLGILSAVINLVNEHNLQKPFHMSDDKELSTEDKTFICKIMKLDPRDRPTAKELLQDEWFR
jgi:casein kinase II subunit alpha